MKSYMKGWSFIIIICEHVWTRSRIRESYEWLKKWMNRCAARFVFVTFTWPSPIRWCSTNNLFGYLATIRDSAALGYAAPYRTKLLHWIPDGSFVPDVAWYSEVLGSNPGRSDVCHQCCIYIQCSKLFKDLERTVSGVLCTRRSERWRWKKYIFTFIMLMIIQKFSARSYSWISVKYHRIIIKRKCGTCPVFSYKLRYIVGFV